MNLGKTGDTKTWEEHLKADQFKGLVRRFRGRGEKVIWAIVGVLNERKGNRRGERKRGSQGETLNTSYAFYQNLVGDKGFGFERKEIEGGGMVRVKTK